EHHGPTPVVPTPSAQPSLVVSWIDGPAFDQSTPPPWATVTGVGVNPKSKALTPLRTVKFVAVVAVPPGVVTEIGPVDAPTGTFAVIEVSEFTVNDVEATPLNLTTVVPVKVAPMIDTGVPGLPVPGGEVVIVGAGCGRV